MFNSLYSYVETAAMSLPFTILFAFLLDMMLGDPEEWPHVIRWIGKGITFIDARFNKTEVPQRQLLGRGILLAFVYPSLISLIVSLILRAFFQLSLPLYYFFRAILAWQLLAIHDLAHEAGEVARVLKERGIEAARRQLSRIVGRDTSALDESACCKATVETVAENFSDGIVAPLLFLLIFDLPGMVFYKTVNTLDSMVAYRNDRYEYFGKASARLDDVLNFLPSRLAALILMPASLFLGLDTKAGWRVFKRDRYKHPSPNSAQTEAFVAGAMRLTLGGPNLYHGKMVDKPSLGDDPRKAVPRDIDTVIRLLWAGSALTVLLFTVIAFWRGYW